MTVKIPLFTSAALGYERKSMITFSVKYRTLPKFYLVAIVDTGCPFFIVPYTHISKTRISYKDKPDVDLKKPFVLGGFNWDLKDLGECEIFFRDCNNEEISFKHDIYVGVPQGLPREQAQQIFKQLPCFIGEEFLNKNFLSIIISKDGNKYLQQIE